MEEDKPFWQSESHPASRKLKRKHCRAPKGPPAAILVGVPSLAGLWNVSHPHSRELGLFSLAKLRRRGNSFVFCKNTRGMYVRVGEELSNPKDPIGMRANGGSVAV